jgi:hypothetical protein
MLTIWQKGELVIEVSVRILEIVYVGDNLLHIFLRVLVLCYWNEHKINNALVCISFKDQA